MSDIDLESDLDLGAGDLDADHDLCRVDFGNHLVSFDGSATCNPDASPALSSFLIDCCLLLGIPLVCLSYLSTGDTQPVLQERNSCLSAPEVFANLAKDLSIFTKMSSSELGEFNHCPISNLHIPSICRLKIIIWKAQGVPQ